MKVQNQAPVQTATASTSASAPVSAKAASTARAEGSAAAASGAQLGNRFKDEFVQGKPDQKKIIDCFPPFPPQPKDTMGLKDHFTASRLPETLSNPLNKAILELGKKDVELSRDDQGVWRGPEGQPLAKVKLEDGTTAYVDPNTNKYYLTDEKDFFGQVNAAGPLDLPRGAQFSNSYFSDADVRSIEKDAKGGSWLPHPGPIPLPLPHPLPRPFPPIEPMPLPLPLPFDGWGPLPKIDPSDLLAAAGAGKVPEAK